MQTVAVVCRCMGMTVWLCHIGVCVVCMNKRGREEGR